MKKLMLTLSCVAITLYAYPQWTQTNGPTGDIAEIIEVSDYLFINTGQGGIYRSADRGKNWQRTINGLPHRSCNDLASFGTKIYVSIAVGGVYYSEDFGENWIAINNGIENTVNYELLVDGNDLWAGSSDGVLYYSSDHGTNWTALDGPVLNGQVSSMATINGKLFGCAGNIYVSEDKGQTWTPTTLNISFTSRMFVNGNSIYVADDSSLRIQISHDGGVTWTQSSSIGSPLNWTTVKAISAMDDIIFVCASAGDTFISQDNGQTWGQLHTDLTYNIHNDMVKSGTEIFLATSDGVFYSPDEGSHWEKRSEGIVSATSEFLVWNDTTLVVGGTSGLHTSNDHGETWKTEKPYMTGYFKGIYAEGLAMVVANSTFIIQTTTGGLAWITREQQTSNGKYISTINGKNGIVMATVPGSGIYLSEDHGTSWTFKTDDLLTAMQLFDGSHVEGDTLIVAGVNGVSGSSEMLISTDFGDTWRSVPLEPGYFRAEAYKFHESKLYVGSTNGVYSTSDLAVTPWERKQTNRSSNIFSFNIIKDTVFVVTTDESGPGNTLISYDQGTTWYEAGHTNLRLMSSVVGDNYLFAGSYGQGIWKISLDNLNVTPVITGVKEGLSTRQGQSITLTAEHFEIDNPEDEALTITIPEGESYTVTDNNTLSPSSDFFGTLTINVTVNDGQHESEPFEISIEVVENVRPQIIGIDEEFVVEKNETVTLTADIFNITDPDDTEITLEILPGDHYAFSGNEIIPETDFVGDLTVGVVANDGFQDSEIFNVTIKVVELITALGETTPQNMTIYPVPVVRILFIDARDIHEDRFVIQDALGREIVSDHLTPRSINEINLEKVPFGLYFLKVRGQKIIRFGKM